MAARQARHVITNEFHNSDQKWRDRLFVSSFWEPGRDPVVGDVGEHAQQPEFDSHRERIPSFLTKEPFSYKKYATKG